MISTERYEVLRTDHCVPSLLNRRVEQFAIAEGALVSCDTTNSFAKAAHDAFYEHHPLRIRPDDIWFCIAQGFASHVNLNADGLRERLVSHQGRLTLTVERADFQLGQPNPWPEVFASFSEQIGEHVGKLKELLCGAFSTTTALETVAFEVACMDTFQGFFEYKMLCGCGIPEILLEGTPDDWRSIRERCCHLSEYGLEEWTEALIPVLEEIERSAAGEVDEAFWRSFFRYQSGSGPSELTGWILTLFPYIKYGDEVAPNPFLASWRTGLAKATARTRLFPRYDETEGPGLHQIPSSMVSAPVICIDVRTGVRHDLRFVAGMFGVTQAADTGALRPCFGWAVVHTEALRVPKSTRERVAGTRLLESQRRLLAEWRKGQAGDDYF